MHKTARTADANGSEIKLKTLLESLIVDRQARIECIRR